MAAELWVIRLSKAAKLWIIILYTAAKLQFVRLLKIKHKRKLRLFIITNEHDSLDYCSLNENYKSYSGYVQETFRPYQRNQSTAEDLVDYK